MTRVRSSLVPLALMLVASALACAERSRENDQAADTTASATEASTSAGSLSTSQAFLDPNTASNEELRALPGMDTAAADAILRGRNFGNMVAVDRALASHLTEAQRDSVYTRLWKPIDLNTATDEEILLIPGVGQRMLREFKEYRPYDSIERFRREIGKYVDDAEVARLERYVTLRKR
jgi:DNA uptake protein ComE-like DNA-binding protein